jgi:hypothetical protein
VCGLLRHIENELRLKAKRFIDFPRHDTARTDLLNLMELKLLIKQQIGKAFVFTAVNNLREAGVLAIF